MLRHLAFAAPLALALAIAGCAAATHASTSPATTSMAPPPAELTDVHSFARPDVARVTHIALDWTVDFEKRELIGTATLKLARSREAREVMLDTRDLTIESVESAESKGGTARALPFELAANAPPLGAALRVSLDADTQAIRVRYRTSPDASGLQWLTPEQTAGKKHPYLFSQAQAINARSFLPCQDSPGIRVTYEAVVRVPDGLVAVMSAENKSKQDERGVFRFAMQRAIPSYLIAIAVGELAFKPIGARTGVWSEPSVVGGARDEFRDLERMLEAIEGMFGPYRWGRYDVLVLPPSFPFGGMENPCMTFATPTLLAGDRSLVNVIAHELAHSWSGNLVTNATWRDFWLNEGFTVYLERRIVERLYGEKQATREAILGRSALRDTIDELSERPGDTRLFLDLAGRDPDDGMTDVAYEKGALFLIALERSVGRAKFDPFLRAWFDEHAFQPVTTGQFERFVRERLLAGDAPAAERLHIDDWINGQGLRADAPDFDASVFAASENAARDFVSGARRASDLDTKGWVTVEWLRFLESLPKDLSAARMAELDAAFELTRRGNSEIAAAWLECAIRADYAPAYPRLEEFLVGIGRRKFLKPLYTELAKTPAGLARGKAIYAKARPGYHPIARGTIDKILGWTADS